MRSDNIKIFKSFVQRLEEYTYILTTFSPAWMVPSSATEIVDVWSNYLELQLEPKGWKAIWYILRQNCVNLGLNFPKVVEVMVRNFVLVLLLVHNNIVLGLDLNRIFRFILSALKESSHSSGLHSCLSG